MKTVYRKVIKIGNSNGVILPKSEYEFHDLNPGDWVEIKIKVMR